MSIPKNKSFTGRITIPAMIFVIILAALVYINALQNYFILDDFWVVVNNDFVKSFRNLLLLFSKSYLSSPRDLDLLGIRYNIGSGETSYRPIVTISYFLDYAVWKLNPLGYHLTNLLLHVFNIILFYLFAILITKNKQIALLGSLLFSVHPVNAEAVNTICFREDLLAFLFFISSLILYIRIDNYSGKKKSLLYFSSLLLFCLALFSKEMAITLPIILFLYDYYFTFCKGGKEIWHKIKSRYLGYIVVCLFYLWVWAVLIGFSHNPGNYLTDNFCARILTTPQAVVNYIKWIFLPIDVRATLPDDPGLLNHNLSVTALLSVTIIIACLFLAVKLYKRSKLSSFLIFWFFITLLPVYNIFPLFNSMASRYLYIPLVGPCLLFSMAAYKFSGFRFVRFSEETVNKLRLVAIVMIAMGFSVATIIRNYSMNNNITLCLEMIRSCPRSALAHYDLGYYLMQSRLLDRAIEEHKIAIRLNPHSAKYYDGLGTCYLLKGRLDNAIAEYKKAISLDPHLIRAYANLGVVFSFKGLYQEAILNFEKALKIDPEFSPARVNIENLRDVINSKRSKPLLIKK